MKDLQLVAIDIDGTLLNDSYEISARNTRIIQELVHRNIHIVLASGRGPISCVPVYRQLQLKEPMITHNGAVIFNSQKNEVLEEIGFAAEDLHPLIDYCRKEGIHFDMNTAFTMYIEHVTPQAAQMYEKFHIQPQHVLDATEINDIIVKFTLFGDAPILDQTMKRLVPLFPQWRIIRSGETFIDIIHPQATKGKALRYLMNMYAINPEQVITFGNYFNDLEMLEIAGFGVAMHNSPLEVRQRADYITASNNDDGVAAVLENWSAMELK